MKRKGRSRRKLIRVLALILAPVVFYLVWWGALTRDRIAHRSVGAMVGWVAFGNDGVIASANHYPDGGLVRLWKLSPDGLDPLPSALPSRPGYLPVQANGDRLVCLDRDHLGVVIWDLALNREVRQVPARMAQPTAIAISANGSQLALYQGDFELIDTETGIVSASVRDQNADPITLARFTPDGRYVVTCSRGGRAEVFDSRGRSVGRNEAVTRHIQTMDVSPDGNRMVVGNRSGELMILTLPDLKWQQTEFPGDSEEPIQSVAFSPDGLRLAVSVGGDRHPWPANPAGRVYICDFPSCQVRQTFRWFWGVPRAVAFSPDGHQLVVGVWTGAGGSIQVWRIDE